MRRLELVEGSSSKFWEVEVSGSDLTVRFGRIGTAGQEKTKSFADPAAAVKERDKLIKEKIGKGYADAGGAPAPAPAATAPAAVSAAPVPKPPPAPAAAPAPVPAPAVPPPAGGPLPFPQGGFQWTPTLRAALPVVRGIHVPPRGDMRVLLDLPVTFNVSGNYQDREFDALAKQAGRGWSRWHDPSGNWTVDRDALRQADPELWLEVGAQVSCVSSRSPELGKLTLDGWVRWGGGLQWLTWVGLQHHGLGFMVDWAFAMARIHPDGRVPAVFGPLRHAIAAAPDTDHDAVIAAVAAHRTSPVDRLVAVALCPHREDWATESFAEQGGEVNAMDVIRRAVLPLEAGREMLSFLQPYAYHAEEALLLHIHLHGEAAFDALASMLTRASDTSSAEAFLALAMRLQAPGLVPLLAGLFERKEVRVALDKLSERFPAAVLAEMVRQAEATRSSLAEGWAMRLALREPEACARALATLGEATRAHFEGLLAALHVADAPAGALPPLLREPPWLTKARTAELPTLDLPAWVVPPRFTWTDAELAGLRAVKTPYVRGEHDRGARSIETHVLLELKVVEAAHAKVLAGGALEPSDLVGDRWSLGESPEVVLRLPDLAGLAVWNSYPGAGWYTYGRAEEQVRAVMARHGEAGMPGFAAFLSAHPEEGLRIASVIDSPLVVPVALHALRNLKKAKGVASEWLRAHAATALATAVPMAFGKDKAARDNAQFGLRWFAANGFEAEAREAAVRHGEVAAQALQALLDADPLRVLPARMPKLPAFFVSASFRRPELRDGAGALPTEAMDHIGTMLAISKIDAPYVGLDIVREACSPASLAAFAWDVFEAWIAAGAPSKENWAFIALGLLGDDETARRLAPRIREWPGESQHQRAVTGLDLLAMIGTDVALMHLNGIAGKVKFKALQERAKEKISAVAEARGLTAAELADRLVPDLGLDDTGTLRLDFGPRQFFVSFDETLKPFVKDAAGVRLKDLPKPLKTDDAAMAEEATERYKQMKKDAKAIASLQVVRLELSMVARRRWSPTDFRLFFIEQPLMRHLAGRLVWGVYGADDGLTAAFRVAEDRTFADGDDTLYELPADARVGLAHVMDMPAATQAAFGQVFADYEILQPFRQLGRETYVLTDTERQSTELKRFADKTVATGSVLGLVNRGWERGAAQDAGWVGWFSKDVGDGLQVDVNLDPGTIVGDMSYEPKQTFPSIVLRQANTWDQNGHVAFERLHPILASEVLRDIDLLSPLKE
jgi:predicted DNA-binding WGR domain protein